MARIDTVPEILLDRRFCRRAQIEPLPSRVVRTYGRTRRVLIGLAALTMFGGILAACAPPPPPPPAPVAPTTTVRDLAVTSRTYGFVDWSRGIPAYDWFGGTSNRPIPTKVWFPVDRAQAPYPLVIFAPGFGVGPDAYEALLSRIASAGYVVAAPLYPILSGWPAGPSDQADWGEKWPDTWFVTTSMLELGASGDPQLGGMIDPARIAVAGHSDGALISFGDGFHAWRNDARIRAVVSYAARLDEPGAIYQPNGRAFLHVLSDQDEYNDFGASVDWDHQNLGDPHWTVGLWNANHADPYWWPGDPHFDFVARVTLAFLDQELKGASPLFLFLEGIARPDLGAFV
jgi:hypothetical protein